MRSLRAFLCIAALAIGCEGERAVAPAPAPELAELPTVPVGDQLYALDQDELGALFDQVRLACEHHAGTADGARLARELARIATAIVRLGGAASYVERARGALRVAAELDCEVALDLARLEARVGHDLAAAHAVASALVKRFADEPAATSCVREGRRMASVLERHSAAEARQAAAERSAGDHAHGSIEVVGGAAVQSWAAGQQRAGDPGSRLEEVVVYGADPHGELPLSDREVRVVLRFEGVAIYRRGTLPAKGGLPRRVFLALDRVARARALPSAGEVGGGGLQMVRIFTLDDETTRVSFDVGASTGYRLFFLSDPYRVVMDFRDQGRAAAATAARTGLTVVLDPGHGGEQPGAKGPDGLKESSVALALARRVRARLLRKRPDVRVVLTRDEDRFLTLEERTAIANGVDADLFLSIHLNASHSAEDKGGVSTFVLDTTNDEAALRLAARENGTDAAGVTQLQFILASLYRADQVDHSLSLAGDVQRATLRAGRQILPNLYDRGVKRALFYVLVGARMPAALVEASFITRPEEAAALRTDEYRDALAEGIASGVLRYLDRQKNASK